MIRLALTGSIGMGKSTTAAMIAEAGVPVWDADAAVHRLYGPGQPGAQAIAVLVPGVVDTQGVDRPRLRAAIQADPGLLPRVEAAIHPLVAADRAGFLARAEAEGAWAALCDIPLLFETGAEGQFDAVIVVSTDPATQAARVLARPGMTPQALATILARQLPDAQKRARADYVIETGAGLDAARAQVTAVLAQIRESKDA